MDQNFSGTFIPQNNYLQTIMEPTTPLEIPQSTQQQQNALNAVENSGYSGYSQLDAGQAYDGSPSVSLNEVIDAEIDKIFGLGLPDPDETVGFDEGDGSDPWSEAQVNVRSDARLDKGWPDNFRSQPASGNLGFTSVSQARHSYFPAPIDRSTQIFAASERAPRTWPAQRLQQQRLFQPTPHSQQTSFAQDINSSDAALPLELYKHRQGHASDQKQHLDRDRDPAAAWTPASSLRVIPGYSAPANPNVLPYNPAVAPEKQLVSSPPTHDHQHPPNSRIAAQHTTNGFIHPTENMRLSQSHWQRQSSDKGHQGAQPPSAVTTMPPRVAWSEKQSFPPSTVTREHANSYTPRSQRPPLRSNFNFDAGTSYPQLLVPDASPQVSGTASGVSKRKPENENLRSTGKPRKRSKRGDYQTGDTAVQQLLADYSEYDPNLTICNFFTEKEADRFLEGEDQPCHKLGVIDDDYALVEGQCERIIHDQICFALSQPFRLPPEDLEKEKREAYILGQNRALKRVQDCLEHQIGRDKAGARVTKLIALVKKFHKDGIPMNALKVSRFTEEEVKNDTIKTSQLKTVQGHYLVAHDIPCIAKLRKIIEIIGENKLIACDVLTCSVDGPQWVGIAAAPADYLYHKTTNGDRNKERAVEKKAAKRIIAAEKERLRQEGLAAEEDEEE